MTSALSQTEQMQQCTFWRCLFVVGPGVQRAGWGLPGELRIPHWHSHGVDEEMGAASLALFLNTFREWQGNRVTSFYDREASTLPGLLAPFSEDLVLLTWSVLHPARAFHGPLENTSFYADLNQSPVSRLNLSRSLFSSRYWLFILRFFFLMWPIVKVFIECVTILPLFYDLFFFWRWGM